MTEPSPATVRLADYAPPAYLVDAVDLVFRLAPTDTRVRAAVRYRPNPARPGLLDLALDGESLRLVSCEIGGTAVPADAMKIDAQGLTIAAHALPEGPFTLVTEVAIDPEANTALEGLYMSRGMYCTQCEAEGFRKITYYPDRPDVMAPFRVRVEADLPVLLSNGNPTDAGPGWAEWTDPWPKPAYLFALVAGDLVAHRARFTTMTGRDTGLAIWVRPGDEDRCGFAMDALIRSMRWDEEAYGRAYDLEVFNIVAVDDFNMGAMENKGLNIFNARYVLASPDTATDADYERIEAIIAHEYFHNWTGNRITCRDWFQLCLKEGLTVYRDRQFTGDMRSGPVKRIEDVLTLRARQFREDAGPLAHAVRPDAYVEINNFYTATVYEKGAEVIGMLRLIVGDAAYEDALSLYFTRHDGQACTIEDWIAVFEDTTGRDLSQFKRWYGQAGTPRLAVRDDWDGGTYRLTLRQTTPPTPGQPLKEPLLIPVAVGLLDADGDEVEPTQVLELSSPEQTFTFAGLAGRPVPSLLRGFSAPVILEHEATPETRAFLLAHDTDAFNRWEAGRALAREVLARMVTEDAAPGPAYLDALERVARSNALDPAFRALVLSLPSEDEMAQALHAAGVTPDPDRIHAAREDLTRRLARHLEGILPGLLASVAVEGPYSPDARAAGMRSLGLAALRLVTRLDDGARAARQFAEADNMTMSLGALACLMEIGHGQDELARFGRTWAHDRLVMDKWFALQVTYAAPRDAASVTTALTEHPAFDWKVPNRFRAVLGALAGNTAGFHDPSGASYRLLADWLLRLDPVNPQTAARMSTAFETWARYDAGRQDHARAALARVLDAPSLSRDLGEMAGRMLAAGGTTG